jgi:caa(3)-type oxidase subunit IV
MTESRHPDYRKIYFVLLALLVISVAGPFVGIRWITLITAFGIAVVKARLVVQNFMHLKWEKRIVKWMLASSLALMALFFTAVAPDVMKHSGRNWVNDAALAATQRGIAAPGAEGGREGAAAEPAAGAVVVAAAGFDARAAFSTICASCHGAAGGGDGPGASGLSPKPAKFSDPAFWAGKTDAELLKAIREGGAAVGRSATMPAWGSLYDEAQARALLAFVKTLARP